MLQPWRSIGSYIIQRFSCQVNSVVVQFLFKHQTGGVDQHIGIVRLQVERLAKAFDRLESIAHNAVVVTNAVVQFDRVYFLQKYEI